MMRKVFLLLLPVCLIAVAACQDDEYVYPNVVTEFIDGQTNEAGTLSQLVTDKGKVYTIQPREGLDGLVPDSVYRTVSVYQPIDGSDEAFLYSAELILAMRPLPDWSFQNGIKTDPVNVRSVWQSGEYINLILLPLVKEGSHAFHFIDYGITESGGTRTLALTLYHDRKGDSEAFTREVCLSIPLWPYRHELRKGDTVVLQINTYDEGVVSYTFAY